jgi:purine-nucleoside phosphorylase
MNKDNFLDQIQSSAEKALNLFAQELAITTQELKSKLSTALITGSGLNDAVSKLSLIANIDYAELPCMSKCTAYSHLGKLALYHQHQHYLLVFHGRFHLYEGRSAKQVSTPVYFAKFCGIEKLVITNAAGALNPDFMPGSLMLIEDHINFTGHSPLIGDNIAKHLDWGDRFPDMSQAYDLAFRQSALDIATGLKIDCHQGIYVGVSGPNLETSAERRYFRSAGGDAVGMSTVLENIAANHAGIKVLGISAITNSATGGKDQQVDTIEAVLEQADICASKIACLLPQLIGDF